MSFFDDASLVFLPSGQAGKDGKAYSMKPTNGDGDFTFSRGSNLTATRVDSNGLIEKGRENLLTYSNDFSNAAWTKATGNIVTGGQSGYDGSNDAWEIEAASNNYIFRRTNTQSGVQTLSMYVKKNATYGIRLYAFGTDNANVYYDLNTGVVVARDSDVIDDSITDVGNDWWRITMTYNQTNTQLYFYVTDNSNALVNGGTLVIQDVQLELGLAATEYIESGATTGKAGILEDSPRFDYSGGASCPSLLLEPSRTNLIGQSEYFDDWTNSEETDLSVNNTTSPEGVQNAYSITPQATSNYHRIYNTISVVSGNQYSFSFFAKPNGNNFILFRTTISGSNRNVCFNISNGTIDFESSAVDDAQIEDYGNGWYRCIVIWTSTTTSQQIFLRSQISTQVGTDDGINTFTGNGNGAYLYGAQLEQGSYPTSYIPNHSGGSVTREADSCLINPMSTEYSTNYTFFGEFERIVSEDEESILMQLYDGNAANTNQYRILNRSNAQLRTRIYFSSSNTSIISATDSFQLGQTIKWAVQYDSRAIKVFIDGAEIGDTTQMVGGIDVISLERMKVKQILLFDSTLSDAECITLTS